MQAGHQVHEEAHELPGWADGVSVHHALDSTDDDNDDDEHMNEEKHSNDEEHSDDEEHSYDAGQEAMDSGQSASAMKSAHEDDDTPSPQERNGQDLPQSSQQKVMHDEPVRPVEPPKDPWRCDNVDSSWYVYPGGEKEAEHIGQRPARQKLVPVAPTREELASFVNIGTISLPVKV